jgi:hypothetical protein
MSSIVGPDGGEITAATCPLFVTCTDSPAATRRKISPLLFRISRWLTDLM